MIFCRREIQETNHIKYEIICPYRCPIPECVTQNKTPRQMPIRRNRTPRKKPDTLWNWTPIGRWKYDILQKRNMRNKSYQI